jgi:hypothetical protein
MASNTRMTPTQLRVLGGFLFVAGIWVLHGESKRVMTAQEVLAKAVPGTAQIYDCRSVRRSTCLRLKFSYSAGGTERQGEDELSAPFTSCRSFERTARAILIEPTEPHRAYLARGIYATGSVWVRIFLWLAATLLGLITAFRTFGRSELGGRYDA